jgi:hypothetical protein
MPVLQIGMQQATTGAVVYEKEPIESDGHTYSHDVDTNLELSLLIAFYSLLFPFPYFG